MKHSIYLVMAGLVFCASNAMAQNTTEASATPTTFNVKVLKFGVGANPDCSDIEIIIDNGTDPDAVEASNFLTGPTLASGTLADGTYKCVYIEMSDNITYTYEEQVGTYCTDAGETQTLDVCGIRDNVAESVEFYDGTTADCTDGEDRVPLYLTTISACTGGDCSCSGEDCTEGADSAFQPPQAGIADTENNTNMGFLLSSPLVVAGTAVGTFVTNSTDAVISYTSEGGNGCELTPPTFSFE